MGAPLNLKDKVFGRLKVLKFTGKYTTDSRKKRIWLCACECGRKEELSQYLLPLNKTQSNRRGVRYACTICMRGPCTYCGGEIISSKYRNTCSDYCHTKHKRRLWMEQYFRRFKKDPNLNKKKNKKYIDKIKSDPLLYKEYLESERLRSKKRRDENGAHINELKRKRYWDDHESNLKKKRNYRKANYQKILENQRMYYAKNAEYILSLRAEKFNELSEDERELLRIEINNNARKYHHERIRKDNLEKLFTTAKKLKGLNNNE